MAIAEEPRIYLIELANPNYVLLHFNTDPKRTYTLQHLDVTPSQVGLSANGTSNFYFGKWTNLAVIPAIPFPNHYIFADTRTNQVRFYRLLATP